MSKLDKILTDFPLPTWRPLAWTTIFALVGGAVWASTASLDRIAIAEGRVAPMGQVRIVQHLEGGIAEKILVREGEVVVAGQPLLQVDLGSGGLHADEIQVRLDALSLERARLVAETAKIDLALPEAESARQPDLARAEEAAYRSRRREYESSLAVLRDQKNQQELEVSSIVARLAAARRRLDPLREQREIAAHLNTAQLMPRTQLLALEQEFEEIDGEIKHLEIALPQAQAALAEARERELYERNRFRREASDRLRVVEVEMARQRELYARASNQELRTVIESPIGGVVKNLHVNTLGGVIRPGEPIMEIVPTQERLVIEARLSPNDVGHVRVGQPATAKIATYDFLTYGSIEGEVGHIAADATITDRGDHYFKIIIETERDYLGEGDERYPISSGMTASVDIKLGERTVASYLAEPVLKLQEEAFRDR